MSSASSYAWGAGGSTIRSWRQIGIYRRRVFIWVSQSFYCAEGDGLIWPIPIDDGLSRICEARSKISTGFRFWDSWFKRLFGPSWWSRNGETEKVIEGDSPLHVVPIFPFPWDFVLLVRHDVEMNVFEWTEEGVWNDCFFCGFITRTIDDGQRWLIKR